MLTKVIESKTFDEAKKALIKEFNLSEDKIKFNIIKEKKGLFGIGNSLTVEGIVDIDIAQEGLDFLNNLFSDMEIKTQIEMRRIKDRNEVKYSVDSDQNPLLIGKDGRTMDQIQLLLRSILNQYTNEKQVITLDIGGYKDGRKKKLEILATKTAKEVLRTKIEVKLDPMNSYERKIIHSKLSDWRDIKTESIGETPNRRLVIKPKR